MAATTTTLLVAGLVTAAIGAGVSAYGQHQQGKSQEAISQFNAAQQEREAQQQLVAMQAQAALQRQEAAANFALQQSEAEARENNARALEQQALTQDAIDRENLRKVREEGERLQAGQRVAIAASGVVESTGTPLELIADTAGRIQQEQEDQQYGNELRRRTLFQEAERERLGGRMALAGATLDRDSRVAEAALREAAGQGQFAGGMAEADYARLTGRSQRQGAAYAAAGTLLSGVGDAAGSYAKYRAT